jgi:hypothetical protein
VSLRMLQVHNEGGAKRVIVTKNLPGERWLQILTAAGCRVEVSRHGCWCVSNVGQLAGMLWLLARKHRGQIPSAAGCTVQIQYKFLRSCRVGGPAAQGSCCRQLAGMLASTV